MDDRALLSQLRNGNELAFQALYERHWDNAYAHACRRLDEDAAKDILQDIFIRIWHLRDQLEVTNSFEAYLYGAVKLRVLNYLRDEKARQNLFEKALQRMQEMELTATDLETYKEMEADVSKTIDAFPENMRNIFLMRSENRSVREIAAELGLAEQTVRNTISEALRRLRQALQKKYPNYGHYLLVIATLVGDKFIKN